MSAEPYRRVPPAGLRYWLLPAVVTALLWAYTPNEVSTREALLALALLFIPCYSYGRWQQRSRLRIPFFAVLALSYWASFAMPLFLGRPPVDPQTRVRFREPDVFAVLEMVCIGVIALGIGMKVRLRPLHASWLPDILDSPGTWRYLYCLMILGMVISLREDWRALGAGGALLMIGLANIVPLAICAMLGIRAMQGTATKPQSIALGVFLSARAVIGVAMGELGPVAFTAVILGLVYLSERRRLPVTAIAVVVPMVLFLQVGKNAFRTVYWRVDSHGSVAERVEFWLNASFRQWSDALSSRERSQSLDLFGQSVSRLDLLNQATNVIVKTPRVVPYQNGKTYSYLLATVVPRFVWPDKPSVNEANQFYQVAYGLTDKHALNTVSIAVGCLTEAFMNFGWWGVAPVMFAIGVLLSLFERTLLDRASGLLFAGVGFALMSTLIAVELQAGQYLSGLMQQIAIVFLVSLPVLRRRKTLEKRIYGLPEAV